MFSLANLPARATIPQLLATPAARSLRMALDTVALGSTATYSQLHLVAGPVVQQFYAQRNFAPAWTHLDSLTWNQQARQALALLRSAPEFGLDPLTYSWSALSALPDSLQLPPTKTATTATLAGFELRLTDALLRFSTHLRYGRLHPLTLTPTEFTQPHAQEAISGLLQALTSPNFSPTFLTCQPTSRAYQQLQQAWSHTLRLYPDSLRPTTGNAADFRRVALNLERLRWDVHLPDSGDYALVNIAAYQLHLVQRGQVVQTHRIVVGKPATPTPTLDSRITVFVTAPEWRVPYSIAVNEILPELQHNPGFLSDNNYFLLDYRGRRVNPWRVNWQRLTPQAFPYTIRQTAGRHNALGNMVFYFTNQHGIYLHDTPARALFREPKRARSHGCIRIEKPLDLATFLLKREAQQGALPDIHRNIASHERCRYDLAQGLPIRVRYYTCDVQNKQIRFYADIYCQDEAVATAFFKP
ncbi:L,D-transpeptidase family protein [Hymenobacter norwichensis]|uniref:L,D-transpeptidase family protein n=1 Tax=Hymenobacter norwichensis TaxID=223903 RepID=UPI0003B7AC61|nr:L,D-transpeptidase family protein [Hymenobacter norwichensis]